MRATQTTTYRSLGAFLNRSSEKMANLQLQAATGKRLNRPSDDPTAISPVLSARTQIQQSDRYIETIDTGMDRIDNMDGSFAHIENILQRVREITVAGVNGALSPDDMATYGDEVGQLKDELLSAANAQVDGKYLFGGYQTKTIPFTENPAYDPNAAYDPFSNAPVTYNGDAGQMKMEIAPGEQVRVGVDGGTFFLGQADSNGDGLYNNIPDAFGVTDSMTGRDLFYQLSQLEADLKANRAAPVAEIQTGDFSAVTVAAGETLTFAVGSETLTYTNGTAGALSGAGLVADIATTYAVPTAIGAAGDYSFTQDGGAVSVTLNITQAAGNASTIGPITMTNQTPANGAAIMGATVNGSAGVAARLASFDSAMEQTSTQRSLLGNIGTRLETARGHMEDIKIDMDEMRSRYEDADIIETITQLQQQQQAFEAALNVTGQVSSLSILDYLR